LALPAADLARPCIAGAVLDAVDIALHYGAEPTTYPGLAGPVVPAQRSRPPVTARSTPRAVARRP
ncbi:MAG TPA: hypothetical protein VJX10_22135, partial [Pseudonocardiaceae bacterium]|nr:hypothetical protein [Pseudonocardiaceae bacterium]